MALRVPTHNLSLIPSKSHAGTRRPGRSRGSGVVQIAAVYTSPAGKVSKVKRTKKDGPSKVGGRHSSLSFRGSSYFLKPLHSLLKLVGRQVLISTAEKKNYTKAINNNFTLMKPYYLNPFHAYDEGNHSWLAAAEAEAATMSMTRQAIPCASSLDEANKLARGNWLQATGQHHLQYSGTSLIGDTLDISCSVGVSARYLADKFPSAKVTVSEDFQSQRDCLSSLSYVE